MNLNIKMIGCLLIITMLIALPVSASNISKPGNKIVGKNENINLDVNSNGIVTADLKVRSLGGSWSDSGIKAEVGETLEFKITVEISRSYTWIGVLVELPTVNNKPMFEYKVGSASTIPWDKNSEEIKWMWLSVGSSWSKEITFKEKVLRGGGTKTINLIVGGIYGSGGETEEDEKSDSVDVTVENGRSKQAFKEKIKLHKLFLKEENSIISLFLSKIRTIIMKCFSKLNILY